jgi:hypothetical protein
MIRYDSSEAQEARGLKFCSYKLGRGEGYIV